MKCDNCGNKKANRLSFRINDGNIHKCCETCGNISLSGTWIPDVYYKKPYIDENVVYENNPKSYNGTLITSKRDKAIHYKNLGIRESGDRVHGARGFLKWREYKS